MTNSHFWSMLPYARPDWVLLLALVLLPLGGAVLGWWAGWWARGREQQHETAVGSPADGAVPAAAPAPGAPVHGAGAPGVTPLSVLGDDGWTWFAAAGRDVREAEQADELAAMLGGGR